MPVPVIACVTYQRLMMKVLTLPSGVVVPWIFTISPGIRVPMKVDEPTIRHDLLSGSMIVTVLLDSRVVTVPMKKPVRGLSQISYSVKTSG